MTKPFKSLTPGVSLSDRVAHAIGADIRASRLVAGDRLPTEASLVKQFGVSRTVVREAVSRLKSLGLVESRQGSGAFVKDLGLVLDMARASKFPLPLSSTAHQMFMQASTAGFAKEDDSAVIKIFPGITLPQKPKVTS